MRSKFRLVLDVVLDTDIAANVIRTARQLYEAEGSVVTVDGNLAAGTLSAHEFIDEIEDALMELAQRNPLLINANVAIERAACRSAEADPKLGRSAWPGLTDRKPSRGVNTKTHWTPAKVRLIWRSSRQGYIFAAGRMASSQW
jgi:hypothetical protein